MRRSCWACARAARLAAAAGSETPAIVMVVGAEMVTLDALRVGCGAAPPPLAAAIRRRRPRPLAPPAGVVDARGRRRGCHLRREDWREHGREGDVEHAPQLLGDAARRRDRLFAAAGDRLVEARHGLGGRALQVELGESALEIGQLLRSNAIAGRGPSGRARPARRATARSRPSAAPVPAGPRRGAGRRAPRSRRSPGPTARPCRAEVAPGRGCACSRAPADVGPARRRRRRRTSRPGAAPDGSRPSPQTFGRPIRE